MKKIFFTAISLFFALFLSFNLCGQTYEDNGYLIQFEDGTHLDTIQQIMEDFNSTESWVSPLTETRYWVVNSFPFVEPMSGDTIYDINELKDGADSRGNVNELELNYVTQSIPIVNLTNSTPPGASGTGQCYEKANLADNYQSHIKISILDTGYNPNENNIVPESGSSYGVNSSYLDNNGHGTVITNLIINSIQNNSNANPNLFKWDIRKTHDENGKGYLSSIMLAMEECVLEDVNIINLSSGLLTSESSSTLLQKTISAVHNQNVMIICSAGNEAIDIDNSQNGFISFPSYFSDYNLLTVGSLNCQTNDLSTFSNFGLNSIDIVAPGENIKVFDTVNPANFSFQSGTSFSCAIISGVAAILASQNSDFDIIKIKCAILSGGDHIPSLSGSILIGGTLNARRAELLYSQNCTVVHDGPGKYLEGRSESYDIFVSPNPFSNSIHINDKSKIEAYSLTSIDGKVISQGADISDKDLSFLTNGIYVLSLYLRGDKVSKFIIKN